MGTGDSYGRWWECKGSGRFWVLAVGVCIAHTCVTILEEKLFNIPEFRENSGGAFMTLFMYVLCMLAYTPRVIGNGDRPPPKSSWRLLLGVATIYVGTTTLTKTSLRYIDMPTQTVLKSAKLLPVMLGSVVIVRRRFTPAEWLAASMLVSGIVLFTTANRGQTEVAGGAAGQPRCGRQICVFQPLETTRAWQSYSKPLTFLLSCT